MQATFNTLINSFINDKVGIAENFLSETLAANLKQNLTGLFNQDKLLAAGTGHMQGLSHNKLFRGDHICWLDRAHNDIHENSFFILMDAFVQYLNETCYTSISNYEFHYTLYNKGTFYKKHIDRFQDNDSRQFSMIMYLNENWETRDGGELCIHHEDGIQIISPINGKIVFFRSNQLEHEVLLTNAPRMSITGWLKSS